MNIFIHVLLHISIIQIDFSFAYDGNSYFECNRNYKLMQTTNYN